MVEEVVSAAKKVCKKPLIVKLSPNVTDIAEIARAAEAAGADAISLINTLLGMRIDIERRRPILSNIMGGLSGPAVFPVAVRMVYQVHQAVRVPILGMGGIRSGRDIVEMMLAGASAVAIGTACIADPMAPVKALQELEQFLDDHGIASVTELTGALQV
jgi:dihydroorotate dehydrogenase (NAD+) catalytic subunit